MVAVLVGAVTVLLILFMVVVGQDRKQFSGVRFFFRGRAEGFSGSEIRRLRKAALSVRSEDPASVFWSVKTLDECIKTIIFQNRVRGIEKNEEALAFLSKLYDYRKKIEFDQPKYKSGIRSSRQIDENQRLKMLVHGVGVFPVTVTDTTERYLTITCPSDLRLPAGFIWKGKKISVYFWRQEDAGYVFDSYVLDQFVSMGVPLLRIAHSDSLFRAQKRQSIRARAKLAGTLYLLKRIEGAYEKPERTPGMRCIIEDLSEDGAAVLIGGKAKPGLKMKLQFNLDGQQVVMSGVVKGVDFDSGRNQSMLHFQAMAPSRRTKNIILGYVYNILADSPETVTRSSAVLK